MPCPQLTVKAGGNNNKTVNSGINNAGRVRAVRDSARKSSNNGFYDRFEMAFIILAMHDPRYIKRFTDDGITFGNALANKILLVEESLCNDVQTAIHGISKEMIFEALDPDEEAEFTKMLASIQTGPDDEVFYKETKAGYLVGKYRDEKAEVTNRIAVAEKIGSTEEIEELVTRLMELDSLIDSVQND